MTDPIIVTSVVILWVLVLINLVLTLAIVRRLNRGSQRRVETLRWGQNAPDFTATTLNGNTVSLASYAGHDALFIFVSPTCGPCQEALPLYESLAPVAARTGVETVLVSTSTRDETLTMAQRAHLNMPILVAPAGENPFMQDYKVMGTPYYCLVDANGKVKRHGHASVGSPSLEELAGEWGVNKLQLTGLTTVARG